MDTPIAPEQYQTSNRVLMIRPSAFGYHAQAASSNAFMNAPDGDSAAIASKAQSEFDDLVEKLLDAGVEVLVHQDTRDLPDCVFPNNWLSWHTPSEGEPVVITYPMCDELRRRERSEEILDLLVAEFGSDEGDGGVGHLDLTGFEDVDQILEGTGSLVLDRLAGVAYGCISPRTTLGAFDAWCDETGYESVSFDAVDADGQSIYHTNVMLSIGERVVVVCLETLADENDRDGLVRMLATRGRRVIPITLDQMSSFCGNILELADADGQAVFAMSSRAYRAFTPQQQQILSDLGRIVHAPIPTIEDVGGGSVRCMIAEAGRHTQSVK